jgi:calcium-dependent protein kinase
VVVEESSPRTDQRVAPI